MTRCVAFLRAINVGGHHPVRMEQLRELFASLGLTEVETFIASGNVSFESADAPAGLERRIEALLAERLGYDVATFVRTSAELAEAALFAPFPSMAPEDGLSVGFLRASPTPDQFAGVEGLRSVVDDFVLDGRQLYWRHRAHMGRSRVSGATIERVMRVPITIRNVTTVRKLAARLR